MLNRFKLGRSLDDVYSYGCDLLFSEIALSVCQKEGIDLRFNSLDRVLLNVGGIVNCIVDGVTELRMKIICLFGQGVCQIYQISFG